MRHILVLSVLIVSIFNYGCIFSDKEYEEKLIIETYLLTQEQVLDFFKEQHVNQKIYKDLSNKKIFIVIKIVNVGNKGAWGKLAYYVDKKFKDTLEIKMVGPGKSSSLIYVLPYFGVLNPTNIDKPIIDTYWKTLKTK